MQHRQKFWHAALAWGVAALTLSPLTGFAVEAEGGDQVYDIKVDGVPWRVHVFTTVGTNDITFASGGNVEYLIVAGGGGGGSMRGGGSTVGAGGGGAGGVRMGSITILSGLFPVVVGDGGMVVDTEHGHQGGASSFYDIEAAGGGGGSGRRGAGVREGGSGGGSHGAGNAGNIPPTDPPQGHDGGSGIEYSGGGGGGGAGEPGHDAIEDVQAGNGGDGTESSITGSPTFYGGGGGGATSRFGPDDNTGSALDVGGSGGRGGGGKGAGGPVHADPGVDNTGGGGGGTFISNPAGRGGSGIVVIRYRVGGTTILVR